MTAGWGFERGTSVTASPLRWVRTDGYHLAYRVVETDPISPSSVLLLSGAFVPIEAMWGERGHARFVDGLASLGRLIVFDRRGIGSSDPVSDWSEPILQQWVRDAAAVIEAAGHGPVHVVGWEVGGVQAQLLAAERPDLVRSVAAVNTIAHPERLAQIFGMPLEEVAEVMTEWVTEDSDLRINDDIRPNDLYYRSRIGDPTFARWLDEAGRRGASPTTAARMWRSYCTPGLPLDHSAITAPLLSLRRRDVELLPRELGLEVAERVSDGRFVEIPGGDLAPFCGDVAAMVAEIARFITGDVVRVLAGERRLGVVLFTDIVASTERARELGDDRWSDLLDEYYGQASEIIARRGGRLIKETGDGSVAVFDLVAPCLEAAGELRKATHSLGLSLRQGVHTGEITSREHDIAGLAVHVAARVMAEAGADEILTTATVPLIHGDDGVTFDSRGRVQLRGLDGTWELFAVSGS